MAFRSAVYGRVVAPLGGEWGTISVQPFGSDDIVQYLHCSSIDVAVGDVVAPWTQLGSTGDTCPTGTCNGVHLHLQVVRPGGTPAYPCWSRNYVNPNTWDYANPIIGTWNRTYSDTSTGTGVARWVFNQSVIIHTDVAPAPNVLIDEIMIYYTHANGLTCILQATSRYALVFAGYDGNRTRVRAQPAGASVRQIGGTGTCNVNLNQRAIEGALLLDGSSLRVSGALRAGGNDYSRISFTPLPDTAWPEVESSVTVKGAPIRIETAPGMLLLNELDDSFA